ncbi:MAG: c-type cytochrome [Gammaproteobacteria bacterium]|nr:c-type cytochrome [Gammaproteobacteria bacterium]
MQALAALIAGAVLSGTVVANTAHDAIAERIKPVGEVCLEGQECGAAAAPAAAVAAGPRSGEDIYKASCAACHAIGVAGAPKFGVAADWEPRVAQGMETLISHAVNGLNAMPPKGTCATCSDEDIANTVQYMVDNAK